MPLVDIGPRWQTMEQHNMLQYRKLIFGAQMFSFNIGPNTIARYIVTMSERYQYLGVWPSSAKYSIYTGHTTHVTVLQ